MKNTLKYIASFVALVSGFTVYAQNLETGTYKEENGVAYAKRAIINDDGTYTIDLETFVTGEVTQSFEAVPVDVVLVLDVSGSMTSTITNYTYTQASVSSITGGTYGWGYNNTQNTGYYYKYNDSYYELLKGRADRGGYGQNYYYYLQFTANGITYYINNSGQVVSERPNNVTNANTNLLASGVTLYTRQAAGTTTRIQALKTAVEAFINEIKKNDLEDDEGNPREHPLGNRIAIVKFASTVGQGVNQTYYNDGGDSQTTGANAWEDSDGGNHVISTSTSSTGISNYTEVVRKLSFVETDSDDLIDAVNALNPGGATAADYGMQLAYNIINHIESNRNSNKTVVFFTDGEPNHFNGFDTGVAGTAIGLSKSIKGITYGSGDDATHPSVFSVGLFSSKPSSTDNIYIFMDRMSSNRPGATGWGNNAGGTQESTKFFMDASGGSADDLKAIFTAIAHSSGGSGNTEVSGGSSLTVDVVSSSFSVPTGFENVSDVVEVLVAPCTGKTTIGNKEYLTFGEEKAPTEYGLPAITPSINEEDNKVSTTGFDYSSNWCGPDPSNTTSQIQPGYHGFKQIIRFIITVNDDAVGGPAVQTNDADSGIYLPGATEPLIRFNRPTVKLPVQIWLQKQGLRPGDSAVFTLYMSPFKGFDTSDPESNDWSNFTKVVVNYDDMDENGLVKIVGLDPDFFYKLKEDAWAFGYTYQDGGIQYTVGDNVQNPFVFVNKPKELKFDEASARNIFNEKTASSGGE